MLRLKLKTNILPLVQGTTDMNRVSSFLNTKHEGYRIKENGLYPWDPWEHMRKRCVIGFAPCASPPRLTTGHRLTFYSPQGSLLPSSRQFMDALSMLGAGPIIDQQERMVWFWFDVSSGKSNSYYWLGPIGVRAALFPMILCKKRPDRTVMKRIMVVDQTLTTLARQCSVPISKSHSN